MADEDAFTDATDRTAKPHQIETSLVQSLRVDKAGGLVVNGYAADNLIPRPGHRQMIKSELVQRIVMQNPHLYQRDVEKLVDAILGEITMALARRNRAELRGFGTFSVKYRPAHNGRNPRTGAHVSIADKSVPFFKAGKEMHKRLNRTSS